MYPKLRLVSWGPESANGKSIGRWLSGALVQKTAVPRLTVPWKRGQTDPKAYWLNKRNGKEMDDHHAIALQASIRSVLVIGRQTVIRSFRQEHLRA